MPPKRKAAHHRGDYHKRAQAMNAKARSNALTRCWRCGLTLIEARHRWGPQVKWNAGHTGRGDELAHECSHCNQSHGARKGNRQRGLARRIGVTPRPSRRRKRRTSRDW